MADKKKIRNGIPPRVGDERHYESALNQLFSDTYQRPLLHAVGRQDYDPERLLRDIDAIKARVAADPDFGVKEAQEAIARIENYHRSKFQTILRSVQIDGALFNGAMSANTTAILRTALTDNLSLIKGLSNDFADFNLQHLNQLMTENPWDLQAQRCSIEQALSSQGKSGKYVRNRTRLITRDQNNKLCGNLTESRHKEVGGREYIWSTSGDERVRDVSTGGFHAELDGTTQNWSSPPTGGGTTVGEPGHPGSGIQCRCVANLVF